MLFTDTVGRAAHAYRDWRHAKKLVIVREVSAAEGEEFGVCQFQRVDEFPAEAGDQLLRREYIIAGSDRRMRSENAFAAHKLRCIGKGRARVRLDILSRQFKGRECRVALIEVIDRRRNAQLPQQPYAA